MRKFVNKYGVQIVTILVLILVFTVSTAYAAFVRPAYINENGLVLDGNNVPLSIVVEKSFFGTTQGLGTGTRFLAGDYDAPAADANLTQASASIIHGTANEASAAHGFIVAGGAGAAAGGAGAVSLVVSGTSITDAGVRTAGDSETIVADITSLAINQYVESSKKWIGQETFTLTCAGGCTHTTYSLDFNYGHSKYEDFGNRDFTVTDFECTGLAGANDSGFGLTLLKHSDANWTYSAAAFSPGDGVIVDMETDYSTESDLSNGDFFAYKRIGLNQAVSGSTDEGVIIKFTTGANNSIEILNCAIGANLT